MRRARSNLAKKALAIAVVFWIGVGVAYATVSPNATYQGNPQGDPGGTVTVHVNSNASTVTVSYNHAKLRCPDPADNHRANYFSYIALQPDHTFTDKHGISLGKLVIQGKVSAKKAEGTFKATQLECTTKVQAFVARPL